MIPQVVSAKQLKLRVTIVVHGLLNQEDLQANKGGLISESFSLWLNPTNNVPNHYPEHFLYVDSKQDSDLAHFLEDRKNFSD